MTRLEATDILKRHFLALKEDEQDAIATELEMPDNVLTAPNDELFWMFLRSACARQDKMADLWDMTESRTHGGRPYPNPWL